MRWQNYHMQPIIYSRKRQDAPEPTVKTAFMAHEEFLELANAKCEGEQGHLVSQRSDLPTCPEACEFDVYYAEESIMGTVGSLLNLTHSGLIFKTRNQQPGVPECMTLQYFGVVFGSEVLLPRIVPTSEGVTLEWRNNSMICYSPMELPTSRWGAVMQRVGSVSGSIFNDFCSWVTPYAERNPGYQMWDVWDNPEAHLATRFLEGSKCDDFIASAMRELHRLGARLDTEDVLYKNCIPFLCTKPPTTIDMSVAEEAHEVHAFYAKLSALGASLAGSDGAGTGGMTLPALLRTIAATLDVFIVYDRRTNTYHRVALAPPYVCMDKLYQPMVMPWQTPPNASVAAANRMETDLGAGVMLSGMAASAVGVLKERLPALVLTDEHRSYIRAFALAALATTAWVLTQMVPSASHATWYAAGMLNGALLLPILLVAFGEQALRT